MPNSVGLKLVKAHEQPRHADNYENPCEREKGTFLSKQMIQRDWDVLQSDVMIKAVLWD